MFNYILEPSEFSKVINARTEGFFFFNQVFVLYAQIPTFDTMIWLLEPNMFVKFVKQRTCKTWRLRREHTIIDCHTAFEKVGIRYKTRLRQFCAETLTNVHTDFTSTNIVIDGKTTNKRLVFGVPKWYGETWCLLEQKKKKKIFLYCQLNKRFFRATWS